MLEIKNHLIDLYQRIGINLLKKHANYCEKMLNMDRDWQETCDTLINEQQTLKDERDRSEAEMQ